MYKKEETMNYREMRFRMLADQLFRGGGLAVKTGRELCDLVGTYMMAEWVRVVIQKELEKAGLRMNVMPRLQGDVAVVYHPETFAGHQLDKQLGREPKEVTEPRWWRMHRRPDEGEPAA